MGLAAAVRQLSTIVWRRHGAVRCFERALQAGGGMVGRCDAGMQTVEVDKIVGSVGRAHTLRGDFCYRRGRAMTARYHRVGRALEEGKALPPLELYKVARVEHDPARTVSEYYVLDGHHRVAMARRLGQAFFDAHVIEYRLANARGPAAGS